VRGALGDDDSAEALAEIAEAGPGGMYVGNAHTLERMREAAFLPQVADRERREVWRAKGGEDAHAHALRLAKAILGRDNPGELAPEIDARVRSIFPADLVSGTAEVPAGWVDPEPESARRQNRRRQRVT